MTEQMHHFDEGAPQGRMHNEQLGRILREAREQRGLSLEEVAQELRLHARVVAALEGDGQAALPPHAFVVGYIRSYGRLLDLPTEELVAMYGRPEPRTPHAVGNVRDRARVDSRALPVRLVTYALMAGLVVFGVLWWFSQQGAGDALSVGGMDGDRVEIQPERIPILPGRHPEAEGGESGGVGQGNGAAAHPVAEMAGNERGGAFEPPSEEEPPMTAGKRVDAPGKPGTAARPGAPLPAVQAPAAPPSAVVPTLPGKPGTTPPAAPMVVAPATAPAAPGAKPAAEPVPLAAPKPAAARGAELSIKFGEDCWTDVRDAAGNRVLYDLAKAGQTRTVQGQAPFKVFLGRAGNAEVTYKGKPFDIKPFTDRNIARFSLGDAADNQ